MRAWLAFAMVLVAAGCSRGSGPASGDVLSDETTSPVVYATTECTKKNPNGTEGVDYCNVKTCKKDAESNCEAFAGACLKNEHHYSGTADAGTCTRVL